MEKKKHYFTGIDQGPWFVISNGADVFVCSHDIIHDVTLDIRGDFDDFDTKRRYAHFICEALNEKAEKVNSVIDSLH
ncbi:MAG: hypothetical protein EBX95_12675 [Acidimicrobiia bacterium]|jgi:hypothetical protein|nr:hypothetical protein [Acidimicrobiia bacterium]